MAELDYAGVNQYWSKARPSILGPYMMDGFGFPAGAGRFRFHGESRIVSPLIRELDRGGTALDLGCGVGCWAEYFARHFAKVVAVEARLIRNLTKSATAIGLVNVSLVVAWLVSYAAPLIAATFLASYLLPFVLGGIWWINQSTTGSVYRN